jgi:hypothetical protein
MAGSESAGPATVIKAKKAPRLTYKQEISIIKNLPRTQRIIIGLKLAGVVLVAVGLEGIVTGNYVLTLVFIPLGVFVGMMPIKIRTDRCIACTAPLPAGQAICPACGAPQM